MLKKILLPQVELNMEIVTVLRWLVDVNDRVKEGQPILEVETQKAAIEVPSSEDGYIRQLCVNEGDEISEDSLLCLLTDTADEPVTLSDVNIPDSITPSTREEPSCEAVTIQDDWAPLSAARLALIAQMQRSLAEIPQVHVARQLDVTPLAVKTPNVTFTHRLILAVSKALAQHPTLRTVIDNDKTKVSPVSVAVAIDTPHGLVAPVLRQTDQLTLEQISSSVQELRRRAESNTLKRTELIDGPFAVTNLGMLDVDFFNAFVFHGQTAVLAVGRATQTSPDHKTAWFSLAVDHRVVDGAEAARFLRTLQQEITC